MKAVQAFFLIPLVIGQVAVAADQAQPSLIGQSDQEPQVVAFYDQQCNQYADAAGLTGEKRDAYVAQCKADAPQVWPVGLTKDEE